jgi:hypothetical protein
MAKASTNFQQAIDSLKDCQKEVAALLKDHPDLSMRSTSVLNRLVAGLSHAAGIGPDESEAKSNTNSGEKLTHVMGIPVKPHTKPVPAAKAAETTEQENEDFDGYIDDAFDDFLVGEPAELRAEYNDVVIRGVAKKCGMEVTPTKPATIDEAFIIKVKEAAAMKAEAIAKEEAAKAAETTEKATPPAKTK